MKRVIVVVLALVCAGVFAEGQADKPNEITCVGMGGPQDFAVGLFKMRHPEITVRNASIDMTTGETITMDALVAAGKAPDIYNDFVGRAAKYKVVEFAQELTIDESQYVPELLDWGRIGDKLYGIPLVMPGQGMVLNLDVLDAVGYKVPDRWTIADFLTMAEKVKAAGYIPTVLFAANPSGDYLWVNWFGCFGAEFYDKGYTKSTLDTAQGLAAFEFLDTLVKRGYVPAGPQSLTDDDAMAIWQTGKVAAMPLRPSWVPAYMDAAIKSGVLKAPFRTTLIPMPTGPGVAGVPTIGAGNMIVVRKQTDAKKLKLIEELIQIASGWEIQSMQTNLEGFATNVKVNTRPNNSAENMVQEIARDFGWMDVGYAQPWYYEIRSLLPQILRDMYAGAITARQARDLFVTESNAILK